MKTAWLVITSIISLRKYFRNIKPNGWGFRKTRFFLFSIYSLDRAEWQETLMDKLLNYTEVLQGFKFAL